jgi:chromosome segregation ATPase
MSEAAAVLAPREPTCLYGVVQCIRTWEDSGCLGRLIAWAITFFVMVALCLTIVGIPLFLMGVYEYGQQNNDDQLRPVASQEIQQRQTALDALRTEKTQVDQRIFHVQNELALLRTTKDSEVQQATSQAQSSRQDLSAAQQRFASENGQLSERLSNSDRQLSQAQSQIAQLEKDKFALDQKASSLQKQLEQLTKEREALSSAGDTTTSHFGGLTGNVVTLAGQVQQALKEKDAKAEALQALEHEHRLLNERLLQTEQQKTEFESQARAASDRCDTLNGEVQSLKSQLEGLRSRSDALSPIKNTLKQVQSEKDALEASASEETVDLNSRLNGVEMEFSEVEQERNAALQRVQELQSELTTTTEALNQAETEKERFQQQASSIEAKFKEGLQQRQALLEQVEQLQESNEKASRLAEQIAQTSQDLQKAVQEKKSAAEALQSLQAEYDQLNAHLQDALPKALKAEQLQKELVDNEQAFRRHTESLQREIQTLQGDKEILAGTSGNTPVKQAVKRRDELEKVVPLLRVLARVEDGTKAAGTSPGKLGLHDSETDLPQLVAEKERELISLRSFRDLQELRISKQQEELVQLKTAALNHANTVRSLNSKIEAVADELKQSQALVAALKSLEPERFVALQKANFADFAVT